MDRKKEIIVELTNVAWSVASEYNDDFSNGLISLDEAKQRAAEHIGKMRYGEEQKDYFWIISSAPEMIMHPYRPDLIGSDLSGYQDNHENKLFLDAVRLVQEKGAGITEYYWQWKDDTSKIVPKLSYVKGFSEWNWILGTGIYLEDVEREITQFKKRLWLTSFLILLLITIILFYVLKQTAVIEEKRKVAEDNLRLSIERYKSLVDVSSEGALMVSDGKIVFANTKFNSFLKEESESVLGVDFSELFTISWHDLLTKIDDPKKTFSFENKLLNAKPGGENVVVSITQVKNEGLVGYIVVVKNITENKRLRLDAKKLSNDVEMSLQLMNQPVYNLVNKNVFCNLTDSIEHATKVMTTNRRKLVCVKESEEVIGVLSEGDLVTRVIAKGVSLEKTVASVMTSPVKKINQNALLSRGGIIV
ncbi:cache domain-containing protein [Psychromonas sp. KJ10-10]|uniref:cache domain-containing protein n=1 Tax=Psychromonas sp. KJ10-10 TaxID=3391823 RepID=UPI0039B686FF